VQDEMERCIGLEGSDNLEFDYKVRDCLVVGRLMENSG